MTREQIEAWAREGEGEQQDFKATTGQRTEAARAVCAMLNHRGGRVLFGVKPDGSVTGQQVTDKTLEDVAHELAAIDPPAFPTIDRVPFTGDKEVIVVRVSQGARKPYTFRGKGYRRVGTTNQELSRDDYQRLLLEQVHGVSRWENEEATGWRVEDFDAGEIVRTIDEAVRRGRSEEPGTRDPAELLRGLGLTREGRVLRAAVILFARPERLLPDYPQALLRLARFKGTDRTEFIDNRQVRAHAFELLTRADQFLRAHLPVAGRVVPQLFERVDDPLYPPLALREALANAICHRDYSIGGGSVAVAVYDDRLEITSSGTLHFGLTVEALFRPHESLPWNPLIASVFYKRGVIESWGRGTLKMAELTTLAGLPRPEIEEAAGCVTVRFRPSRYEPPQRIGHDLTSQQQTILRLLAGGRHLALRAIVRELGPGSATRTVRDDLAFLKRLGLANSAGHGRGAQWFLIGPTG
jgi:ATP-dependent DNA helicase RecG